MTEYESGKAVKVLGQQSFKAARKRRATMKGYVTESGYMGYVNGTYVLFSDERDYIDFMED